MMEKSLVFKIYNIYNKICCLKRTECKFLYAPFRYNLDPSQAYSDEELWHAIEVAQLKSCVMDLPGRLGEFLQRLQIEQP